jgi:hypothetical protein
MLRLSGALVVGASLAAVGIGGPATASMSSKGGATVIKMERDGKDLFFTGPATVERGTQLKIKNKTNPRQVGPHSFSLVREVVLPTSEKAQKACSKKLKKICGAILKWHDVDLQAGTIGENPVDVGKSGWDRKGDLRRKGDSWVAERKGESFKRKVTAPVGKTLTFICVVHANMQGEILVTD